MSLVGTGFAYDPEHRTRQAEILARMLPVVRDVRRIGSCALDLCMVAAGALDAYYEDGVHVWDWAAGALIAAEAGATLRLPSADGGDGVLIAAAPGIADALAEQLIRSGAFRLRIDLWPNGIKVSRRRCGFSSATPGRRLAWRRGAGSQAPRRCRR
jgi:myo-inositol-1(or 4)-monophosphatase